MTDSDYPQYVCSDCGLKYGHKTCGEATWHEDTCDVCGWHTSVTEPRNFGHLKPEWRQEISSENEGSDD